MANMKTTVMKAAMSGLYHSGAHRLLAPYTQGAGVIFTLHHVRPDPDRPKDFAPNRFLEVTPDFLDGVLDQVQEAGLDVVSLDDAVQRLKQGDDRRFASFTFDDGYRDVAEHAWPLFKRRDLPLTLYLPTDFIGRQRRAVVAGAGAGGRPGRTRSNYAATARCGGSIPRPCRTRSGRSMRSIGGCGRSTRPPSGASCACWPNATTWTWRPTAAELVMGWDEVRTLAADPLVTIGAHTKASFCGRQAVRRTRL